MYDINVNYNAFDLDISIDVPTSKPALFLILMFVLYTHPYYNKVFYRTIYYYNIARLGGLSTNITAVHTYAIDVCNNKSR